MTASTASTSLTAGELAGAELVARIRALDDSGRRSVLNYLAGYVPEILEVALREIEGRDDLAERLGGTR